MVTFLADQVFPASSLLHIQQTLLDNITTCESWKPILSLSPAELPFAALSATCNALHTASANLLQAKKHAPLESVSLDDAFATAYSSYSTAHMYVRQYNDTVRSLNELIRQKKIATAAGDLVAVQNALAHLRVIKRRYDSDSITACKELLVAEQARKQFEKDKDDAKAALEKYAKTVFDKYEDRINELLDNFGAGFQIGDTKSRYAGGLPSSQYNLVINNISVDLGDPNDSPDECGFRNTLSGGDKFTLASSFFIARAEQDPKLGDRILVFDDPFTSQDHSRRTYTQQLITTLAQLAKQVIVLSHDPSFLRLIYDGAAGRPVRTLQLSGLGPSGTKLTEWDIIEAAKGGYIESFGVLATFIYQGAGSSREVAQTIRILLEQYMRLKLPTSFAPTEWLGDMIGKVRVCTDPTDPLRDAQVILSELTYINDYAKKYHHSAPGGDTAPIDDREVLAYAKRAIKLVQRF
jgi:wobble nucleotide-excising tRNase